LGQWTVIEKQEGTEGKGGPTSFKRTGRTKNMKTPFVGKSIKVESKERRGVVSGIVGAGGFNEWKVAAKGGEGENEGMENCGTRGQRPWKEGFD